jgi:hypothetical protein
VHAAFHTPPRRRTSKIPAGASSASVTISTKSRLIPAR